MLPQGKKLSVGAMRARRYVPSCPFCRIAAHEEPAALVYEDDAFVAFMDKNPVSEGHVLVAPKDHYEAIFDMPLELAGKLFELAARIARAVWAALKPDGLNLLQNNGPAAWQSIPHVHVHVIPRRYGDAISVRWPAKHGEPEELMAIAEEIKKALEGRV